MKDKKLFELQKADNKRFLIRLISHLCCDSVTSARLIDGPVPQRIQLIAYELLFFFLNKSGKKNENPSGLAEEMLSFYIHKSKQQHIFVCECTKVEAALCLVGCTRCLGTKQ